MRPINKPIIKEVKNLILLFNLIIIEVNIKVSVNAVIYPPRAFIAPSAHAGIRIIRMVIIKAFDLPETNSNVRKKKRIPMHQIHNKDTLKVIALIPKNLNPMAPKMFSMRENP